MVIYCIKNCNTVKKATAWLTAHHIPYHFHDYKKEGISTAKLEQWSEEVGWENLLNKRGTTWRKLDQGLKDKVTNETHAVEVMLSNTSLIKRPVIEEEGQPLTIGFDEEVYKKHFLTQ